MQRSTYIDWLLEQSFRPDHIGDAARWLTKKIDEGFDPVDMFCLLEATGEDLHLTEAVQEGLVEYAITLQQLGQRVSVITDEEALQMKLDSALRTEDYNKAAQLRDQINKIQTNKNQ